jgi:hypothetical protein
MKSDLVGIGLAIVVALAMGASVQCEAADVCRPEISFPSVPPYASQQRVQPVARSVQVTVPMPRPPRPCGATVCLPPPMHCLPPGSATAPSPPMPVRVDIAVRPEECDQRYPVPIVYRDPGFLGPIIYHSVGLIGAAIASPFRVAEMLCPLEASACPSKQRCGPTSRPLNCCYPPPAAPQSASKCPAPITPPVSCRPVLGCAPPGPSVAPLPSCAALPPCGPNLPPALVEEYQFSQLESQNLFSGIWNLPGSLVRSGRLAGDIQKTPLCTPPVRR